MHFRGDTAETVPKVHVSVQQKHLFNPPFGVRAETNHRCPKRGVNVGPQRPCISCLEADCFLHLSSIGANKGY